MRKPTWMIRGVVALVVWVAAGLGVAQAGQIFPLVGDPPFPPLTVNGASTVTVSIFQSSVDVTDTWLPEPGQTVQIIVKSGGVQVTPKTVTLVAPVGNVPSGGGSTNPFLNATTATLTTSAYPGQCTNFDNPSPLVAAAPDFQLSGTTSNILLTSTDCGGMAVVKVQVVRNGPFFWFILPQDSNFNGIPNIWETLFCAATPCPTGKEDNDPSPGSSFTGDGTSALDEYRGFIVSGVHVRTSPAVKDLFVHLVNPQCVSGDPLASTASLLGGGPTTFVTGSSLFTNANTLILGNQVRLLGYTASATNYTTTEWFDDFHHYSVADGIKFGSTGASASPNADDRWVSKNRIYSVDALSNPIPRQKGLRVIECVDQNTATPVPTTPLGLASIGSPNGADNAILYTNRAVTYLDTTLGASTGTLCYQTFSGGSWTTPLVKTRNQIIALAIAFYLAMEIGHSIQLTPAVEASYGYHHAPGTGSNLDQAITNKTNAQCGNLFQIPSLYNSGDQGFFVLK